MGAAARWREGDNWADRQILILSDPVLRRSLEQLPRDDPAVSLVGVVNHPSALLRLIDQNHVDVVLADAPPREQLAEWRVRHNQTAFVVLLDGAGEEDSLDALHAGAQAVLCRSANRSEIVIAIKAVTSDFVVLGREPFATLLNGGSLPGEVTQRQ